MKHLFAFALCAASIATAVAAPKAPAKATPAKTELKTLHYCPTSGEKLGAHTVGATTYKGYKIAFCCGGCPEAFAKLSPKEKDAKIAKIVAKEKAKG